MAAELTPTSAPALPAPALAPAFAFAHIEALAAGKDGGQEDARGDEEDEDNEGNEERFEEERLGGLAGLGRGVAPGSAALQQQLCWHGEQFEQRLFDLAHTQCLHAPELLHRQQFDILI